jgi:hypothetical protein
VRGSTEHFYKAVTRAWWSAEAWASLDPKVKSVATAWTLDHLMKDAGVALNAGTFDARDERHLSRSPIVLGERGWKRVNEICAEALEAILEESSASSAGSPLAVVTHEVVPARRAEPRAACGQESRVFF